MGEVTIYNSAGKLIRTTREGADEVMLLRDENERLNSPVLLSDWQKLEAEVSAHRELLIRWADMAQHMGIGETNLHRESKAILES